jgi:NUMOD4 motif-containing protein/HNH endonuclease
MERWLPVVGYEGRYEVSDEGRVRSHARGRPRLLALFPDSDGYLRVNLYRDAKLKQRGVHQLVLEAFVGPCPSGMESLHGDGVRDNNVESNLRWGTPAQNSADRDMQQRGPQGERNPKCKLTRADVQAIRADARVARLVAADFGVNHSTVSDIRRGRTWGAA